MKEQQKIVILVPLVILIWGYAIYALMSVSGGSNINNTTKFAIEMPENLQLSADSFKLKLNYKDPFLKGVIYKSSAILQNGITQNITPVVKQVKNTTTVIAWPKLIYKGTIKNKNSNKLIAILEINGNEALLKEGDEYMQVDLLKIYSDSAFVGFEKEKKFIVK